MYSSFKQYEQCSCNKPVARCVKLRVAHAPPWVSDPDMHHGTGCMPGSLTSGFLLKSVAGETFPAHAQAAILRIA